MGKGDKKTRRGKLFKGTFGKSRPNPRKAREIAKARAASS
ncbi:MAG: hypothetical protein KatS3mg108_1927 [Isosphaeraceae bacterium]|jgi:30S ribosomal protein S31|nr:MAG: hypothetical protein KatS3mg108_1927 [Isosphaeraceae bacterium]